MLFLISDHYRTARQSLGRARLRTFLTMLGVAIGVASVTAIMALSGGVDKAIGKQVAALGDSIAIVRPSSPEPTLSDLSNPLPSNAYSTSPITERDVAGITDIPSVQSVAPLMTISGSVRSTGKTPARSIIVATTPSFIDIDGITISDGQFIDSVTKKDTAVLGAQLSVELFGTEQSIGQTFTIRGQSFTVIGVLKRQNQPINYNNVDFDNAAIVSLESGKLFNEGVAQIQQINVLAKPGISMPTLKKEISELLVKNHDKQKDTEVFIGHQITRPTSNLFKFVSAVISVIASISLVVGGVGIMNIMLVAVSERTREIGIRKAVGASSMTIVGQFLAESLIISTLGGVLGFGLGYIVAFIISLFIPYDPTFSWAVVGWAASLSIGVGTIFGLYPALKAAAKNPIESLRRTH